MKASIDASPRKVEVSDWTMELDTTKAKGGLTLVLRERPAFGLSLEVDRIKLDSYLPVATGASDGQPAQPAGAAPAGSADGGNPLAVLSAVDANVDIRVGEEPAMGVPV